MKKIVIALCLFVSTMAFSQEWGSVNRNTVTMKEIAPVWPGCDSKKGAAINACFKQKLGTHIAKNFKYPAEAYKSNQQGRVIVEFFITEKGTVDIKKVTGGSLLLQEEARRIINAIPKMKKSGRLAGKPRAIKYTVPITFKTGK